ncbi:hypothetical protein GCM10020258_57900 [Sphingomonas yabuuchiae]
MPDRPPRSKFDGDRFERKNGSAALEVRAGSIWTGTDMVQQPIPWPDPTFDPCLCVHFCRPRADPEIPFGESANDALRILGIDKGGPAYKMFRTQVSALAACSMTIGFTAGDRAYTFHGNPVEQFEAWLPGQEGQRSLWPSSMVLGRRFYETLLDHAVPVDLRAFSSLRGSAMAMDLYLYLVQRLHRISRPVGLTWWMLKDQFGQEYVGEDALADFKKKFKKALAQAQSVYPDAKIEIVRGGIKLFSSRPAVDPKEAKRLRV